MLKRLNRFSERFIPDREKLHPDEVGRIRVFINACILAAIFGLSYVGITTLISYPLGSIGLFISALFFISIPFLLKWGVSYTLLANFFIGIIHASLVVYILTQGGIRLAVVTPYLVFVICIAILFLGFRYALAWTIITAMTMIVLLIMEYYQVSMPIAFDQRYDLLYRGIVWVGLLFLILIVINVFKNSEVTAKARLEEKNRELEETLVKLRRTQEQLIESEKLASLGQMTAGIAHEIQNPLNFIKNFSELSMELIDDAHEFATEDEKEEFFQMLKHNLQKISEHSHRTDRIVKNMLDHAHIHGSEKMSTSLNQLCREMLSMSLQTAKRSGIPFDVDVQTDYDPSDPVCTIVPADTSRILVNLVNNAMYSLMEKQKIVPGFRPVLLLSTSRQGDHVVLRITDNGMGIPEKIQKEIFKPFFTTKPTGEGTGLGLSLSNTIMQAQNGTIELEESSPERTVFKLVFQGVP